MEIIVQKYGGTSVASVNKIKNVARRVIALKRRAKNVVVVVSAMGDMTDELLSMARRITRDPNERELDMLLTAGERISISLLSMAINSYGFTAISFTGSQSGIVTTAEHTNAKIIDIRCSRIIDELKRGKIVIVAGFQGVSQQKEITTLGRGGSDTSAVAIAKALSAKRCELLTDVKGIYDADPRIVKNAKIIRECSYEDAFLMAALGARVLHTPCVQIAKDGNLPLVVASSFNNREGTTICNQKNRHKYITTVTHIDELCGFVISNKDQKEKNIVNMLDTIKPLTVGHDLIKWNFFDEREFYLFSMEHQGRIKKFLPLLKSNRIKLVQNISIVSLIRNNIDLNLITEINELLKSKRIKKILTGVGERNISIVIQKRDLKRAVRTLHARYCLLQK